MFYTEDDWLRLATKLAANASACAQYYISIPPLAADKTAFRSDQAWRIRALGANFHPVAEINYTGWSKWVSANNSTFYDAGVEARARMAAAGFDVSVGDTWAVNELSSAVRAGTNVARQRAGDLVRGLYAGGGNPVRGVVFGIGINQSTADLAPYKVALQGWYQDAPFWQDMRAYVSDWSQELYGDVRAEAVGGVSVETRLEQLNAFLRHQLTLAQAGPPTVADARAFLEQTDSPLANAAWMWASGFGYTEVPLAQMEDYVSSQVAALRSSDLARGAASDHFGFAWAPRMADGTAWTAQFTADTGTLLDRLADAIHDSDAGPTAACDPSWCTASLAGASFNDAWQTFGTWSPTTISFATGPPAATAGTPAGPLTLELRTDGVDQAALAPTAVLLSSSSATGAFSASASGPWTNTLTVTIPAGSSSVSVYYDDSAPGSPMITATTSSAGIATQQETVAAAAASPTPAPPSTSGASGGGSSGIAPDLHLDLSARTPTAPPVGSELAYDITVSSKNAGGASSTTLMLSLPTGYAVTGIAADRGPGCTGIAPNLSCDLAWIDANAITHLHITGLVGRQGEQDLTATVTGSPEPELDPSDNTAILKLLPATSPATPPATPPTRTLHAATAPLVTGVARVGHLLHLKPPRWTTTPRRIAYQWQLCTRSRCTAIPNATRLTLLVRTRYKGRSLRVAVTATGDGSSVTIISKKTRIVNGQFSQR